MPPSYSENVIASSAKLVYAPIVMLAASLHGPVSPRVLTQRRKQFPCLPPSLPGSHKQCSPIVRQPPDRRKPPNHSISGSEQYRGLKEGFSQMGIGGRPPR